MFVRLKLVLVDFKKYRGLVVFSTSDASVLFSLAIHYSQATASAAWTSGRIGIHLHRQSPSIWPSDARYQDSIKYYTVIPNTVIPIHRSILQRSVVYCLLIHQKNRNNDRQ